MLKLVISCQDPITDFGKFYAKCHAVNFHIAWFIILPVFVLGIGPMAACMLGKLLMNYTSAPNIDF